MRNRVLAFQNHLGLFLQCSLVTTILASTLKAYSCLCEISDIFLNTVIHFNIFLMFYFSLKSKAS